MRLDKMHENHLSELRTIHRDMDTLANNTINEIKEQLSRPEECEKRLKPFMDRENHNDAILKALKKYVAEHKNAVEDLEGRVSSANNRELEQQQRLISELRESSARKEKVSELEKNIGLKNLHIQSSQNKVKHLDESLKNLQGQMAQKDSELKNAEDRFKSEAAKKDSELDDVKAKLLKLEGEMTDRDIELKDVKVGFIQLEVQMAQKYSELKNVKDEAAKKNSELDDAKTKILKLEGEMVNKEIELKDVKVKVTELGVQMTHRDTELKNAKDRSIELDHEVSQKDIDLDDIKSRVVELQGQLADKDNELKNARDSSTELQAEVAQKDSELESRTTSISRLENESKQQRQRLDEASRKFDGLNSELLQARSDLSANDQALQTLAGEKGKLIDERNHWKRLHEEVSSNGQSVSASLVEANRVNREAQDELNKIRSQLDATTRHSAATYAASSAVLGQDVLDDIVRLHQAAQLVPSTQIRGGIIPSIQVTRSPSTVPTYQDAFELWMSTTRGMLNVERAAIFLDFDAGIEGAFLPWIHGALCRISETLTSRIEASPVWSMDLLLQLVTVMQLLVSVQHVSQTTSQWVCGLLAIYD